jgi:hypothetical protein
MLTRVLEIPVDETATTTGFTDDCAPWLKPYLAAALRSGLIANWPDAEVFGAEQPITGGEAAVLLQNALGLTPTQSETQAVFADTVPAWAQDALTALESHGLQLSAESTLTRSQAAEILYQANLLARNAPSTAAFQ